MQSSIARDLLDCLARQNIVTSIAYGPCGDIGTAWTVNVLAKGCESFEKPLLALSFEHAVAIAVFECNKRGWYNFYISDEIGRLSPASYNVLKKTLAECPVQDWQAGAN